MNDAVNDREALEWLVYHCLHSEVPCISISRARELLGYATMNDMREWLTHYRIRDLRKDDLENDILLT